MHNLCLNYATNTIFVNLLRITLLKLHVKLQPLPSKDVFSKDRKSAKKRINYA